MEPSDLPISAQLTSALEASSDLVIVIDDGNRIRFMNAAARAFNRIPAEIDSTALASIAPSTLPLLRTLAFDDVDESLAVSGGWRGEVDVRHPDGPVPMSFVATTVLDPDGRPGSTTFEGGIPF